MSGSWPQDGAGPEQPVHRSPRAPYGSRPGAYGAAPHPPGQHGPEQGGEQGTAPHAAEESQAGPHQPGQGQQHESVQHQPGQPGYPQPAQQPRYAPQRPAGQDGWSAPSAGSASHPPPQAAPAVAPPPAGSAAAPPHAISQPAGFASPGREGEPAAPPSYPPAGPARPPYRRRRGRRVSVAVAVLLMIIGLLAGILLGGAGYRQFLAEEAAEEPPAPVRPGAPPDSVAEIAEFVLPSTVYIQAMGSGGELGHGTGLVLREDGYIVTNNHVIDGAVDGGSIVVVFPDGGQEEAELIGRTADYDLAVLQVERDDLDPLPLGDSDAIIVGDPVIAVGAPLGLQGTVTTGIISALNRPVAAGQGETTSFINAIQTDAAINPGNSGGPLVDANGEVVGINTAIAQAAGGAAGSIGLGFAIPANQVRRTTEEIIEHGHATYPVIGVTLDASYRGEGVRVLDEDVDGSSPINPGGPADEAGLTPGELIVSIDGQPVTDPDEFIVAVRARAPGDEVVLGVRRGGAVEEVTVVLDEEISD